MSGGTRKEKQSPRRIEGRDEVICWAAMRVGE